MRILLVNAQGADRFYGGAERYVRDLRDGLTARGHQVAVLGAFPPRSDDSAVLRTLHDRDWREDRLRWARNHAEDWWARLPPGVDRILAELEPELVHTNNLPGISSGVWEVVRRRGARVVHTLHDYGLLCPRVSLVRRDGTPCHPHPLLCGLRSRRLARWAPAVNAVIGVSDHVLRRHGAFFPASIPQTVVLPPLVPTPGVPSTSPPSELRTLGYAGALTEDKGVRLLLSAAPALRARGVTLAIAGGGPLTEEVATSDAVRYVGRLEGDAIGRFMSECDAGIVPSLWEEPGLSFSGLEWLASGRPVLASSRGGLAELAVLGGVRTIEPTESGLLAGLAALSEPAAFAAQVSTVPAVVDDHDRNRWLDDHLAVYDRTIASPGRPPT